MARPGYLEKAADSGIWRCGLAGASRALFRNTQQSQPTVRENGSVPHVNPIPLPDGCRVAESELDIGAIQNLSDLVSYLVPTATRAWCDLRFRLRIELDDGGKLDEIEIERLNEILKEVAPDLRL